MQQFPAQKVGLPHSRRLGWCHIRLEKNITMDRLPTFMLSTNSAYNYTQPNGQSQEVQGVSRGDTSIYCLENDTTSTMLGDMSEAVVLSKEACEAHVASAEEGRIPSNFVEQWGLDLPEGVADQLPDARDMAQEVGVPAVDRMKPTTAAKPSEATKSTEAAKPSETKGADKSASDSKSTK